MNVLITGATGFIGQHLLDELHNDNLNLTVISRKKEPLLWCSNRSFKLLQADISDNKSLEPAFKEVDVVVNLAAEIRDTGKFAATNVGGVKNIIDLSVANRVKKIIHLSSVGVVGMQYSNKKIEVDEEFKCSPKNEYEETKFESECLFTELGAKGGIEINILRPTNVFGDHHPRKALLGFLQRIKQENSFPARKGAVVNYVYVKDVAHAIRHCIRNSVDSKIINVGEAVLFEEFIKMAAHAMRKNSKVMRIPGFAFSMFEGISYFGISALKAKLRTASNFVAYKDEFMRNIVGYKYGIATGLKKTAEFYAAQKMLK